MHSAYRAVTVIDGQSLPVLLVRCPFYFDSPSPCHPCKVFLVSGPSGTVPIVDRDGDRADRSDHH